MNENRTTVNTDHLETKTIVLVVYALSNDKVDLEKDQVYEKLNEMLVNIGMTRELILLAVRLG